MKSRYGLIGQILSILVVLAFVAIAYFMCSWLWTPKLHYQGQTTLPAIDALQMSLEQEEGIRILYGQPNEDVLVVYDFETSPRDFSFADKWGLEYESMKDPIWLKGIIIFLGLILCFVGFLLGSLFYKEKEGG